MLLHVIATPLGIDSPSHHQSWLQARPTTFDDVQHVAGMLVLAHVTHFQRRNLVARRQDFQISGIEGLTTAGRIESRAIEPDRNPVCICHHGDDAGVKLLQE